MAPSSAIAATAARVNEAPSRSTGAVTTTHRITLLRVTEPRGVGVRWRALTMARNLTVIGAQWGDEGKGKIVDLLTPRFSIVARYQGGHNAGHTVYVARPEVRAAPDPVGHPARRACRA